LGIAVRDILLMVIAFNFTNVIVAWPVARSPTGLAGGG
jgi:hypothetical protein